MEHPVVLPSSGSGVWRHNNPGKGLSKESPSFRRQCAGKSRARRDAYNAAKNSKRAGSARRLSPRLRGIESFKPEFQVDGNSVLVTASNTRHKGVRRIARNEALLKEGGENFRCMKSGFKLRAPRIFLDDQQGRIWTTNMFLLSLGKVLLGLVNALKFARL